jgi:hypothetical protein
MVKAVLPGLVPAMTKKRIIFNCWKEPERISGQARQERPAFTDKLRA